MITLDNLTSSLHNKSMLLIPQPQLAMVYTGKVSCKLCFRFHSACCLHHSRKCVGKHCRWSWTLHCAPVRFFLLSSRFVYVRLRTNCHLWLRICQSDSWWENRCFRSKCCKKTHKVTTLDHKLPSPICFPNPSSSLEEGKSERLLLRSKHVYAVAFCQQTTSQTSALKKLDWHS